MLQYMYELDYEVESQHATVPAMYTHARMSSMGEGLDIKGFETRGGRQIRTCCIAV